MKRPTTSFVLVHSPHGGAATWARVAEVLHTQGCSASMPVFPRTPHQPFWPTYVDAINHLIKTEDVVLVAHSGAGPLLGLTARSIHVRAFLYVDAGLTKEAGLPAGLALTTRDGGWVPAWTDDATLAQLIPGATLRRQLIESIRPLPHEHFTAAIPQPPLPASGAYLQLSRPYADDAAQARSLGWPVAEIDGHHYSMVTEPERVADEIRSLAARVSMNADE